MTTPTHRTNQTACATMLLAIMTTFLARPVLAAPTASVNPPEGFTALFNGQNLDDWFGRDTQDPRELLSMTPGQLAQHQQSTLADIQKHWRAQDGELINDGHGLFLTTMKNYGDFELLLEYKTVAGADSGVYLRGCPQVQIWDTTEAGGKWGIGADKGSGGLWNNSAGAKGKDPLKPMDKPFGQWNQLRILMIGQRVTLWFNGEMIVDDAVMENYFDRNRPVPATGPIQLQTHGGEIRWRNVFIREIDADEANHWLAEKSEDGFVSIFNGESFDGWNGPTNNYQIIDGAVICKPGKGGTIHTEKEYGDFVVQFEFKLPPAGNNGLALRYPGQGDTAYVGMCELQVLDNEHPNYAKLDKRQYHGSAYGMAAAHRGYLRATDQWNFQTVTVRGSTIRTEVNGTVILDCDLSKVTQLMGDRPHPGKDRTRGHFGFAGHNDPVQFRNVRIKSLDD